MNKIEIDLHIEKLVDNLAGFSNADILEYQLEKVKTTLVQHKKHKGWKIIFIHGEGKGQLKSKIELLLRREYKQYEFYDASTIDSFKYRIKTAIVVIIRQIEK